MVITETGDPRIHIEDERELPHSAERVWAAIADPEAYFRWNAAVELLDRVEALAPTMELGIRSGVLGRTRYLQRNQPSGRGGVVTHEVVLRLRRLALGEEVHRWVVTPTEAGAGVRQTMDVRLTSWLGRRLRNNLDRQLSTIHAENFELIDAYVAAAPPLDGGRFPRD